MVDNVVAPPKRKMQVLCLGLFRTGTYSMAQALTTLGYADVHHGIDSIGKDDDWAVFGNAADATFASLPTYRGAGKAFTCDEWDQVWRSCEAVTDVASIYGPALLEVYPDAKVILVERDFAQWSKSIETIIDSLWGTLPNLIVGVVEPLLGSATIATHRKMLLGWAAARDEKELRTKLHSAWERHHAEVRAACAATPGRLLNYKMGDGWEPLCDFLGREVPRADDGEPLAFPHVNDTAALRRKLTEQRMIMLKRLAAAMLPWVGAASAAGAGWWWWANSQ